MSATYPSGEQRKYVPTTVGEARHALSKRMLAPDLPLSEFKQLYKLWLQTEKVRLMIAKVRKRHDRKRETVTGIIQRMEAEKRTQQ